MAPLRRPSESLDTDFAEAGAELRGRLGAACGWLPLWKPIGITSFDLIRWLRPAFAGIKPRPKMGHTGTLDPFAEGLVLVAVGPATRLILLLEEWPKRYHATCRLGTLTDTLDLTGTILESREAPELALAQVQAACQQFVGDIRQTPPAYSALKQGGEALYRKARRGEEIDIAPRIVTITRCEALSYDPPDISLAIDCGAGTYIRSLCRDLAEALGTVGHCAKLERVALGPLGEHDAWRIESPEEIEPEALLDQLRPADWPLAGLPWVSLDCESVRAFAHGQSVTAERLEEGPASGRAYAVRVYDAEGQFLGIATYLSAHAGRIALHPKTVLTVPTE